MSLRPESSHHHESISIEPTRHTRETLENWVRWINDPDIRQWMHRDLPTSSKDINLWLYNATHTPNRHYFDIDQNGKQIGFISLRQDQVPTTTGEISIVIGEAAERGKGIGKHALEHMLDYAKNETHLTSVRALIKPANAPSIGLFTGAGFTETDRITVNGDQMIRFEKTLQAENPVREASRKLFADIGLETPDPKTLADTAKEFSRQLLSGGTKNDETSSLMMIDTLLSPPDPDKLKLAAGKDVLVVEFGGSNVRVAIGTIGENGQPTLVHFEDGSPKKVEGALSGLTYRNPDAIFSEAFRIIDATQGVLLPKNPPETIGIIWSFPGYAERTGYGVDVRSENTLTKGIHVAGMDAIRVGEAFAKAFNTRYYADQNISTDQKIAVLNDTPAVLFSFIPETGQTNRIGVVDGTGFNISACVQGTTFNLEAGSFRNLPVPKYVEDMEPRYDNPGQDLTEKQCSGKYVGDQFDHITQLLIDRGLIHAKKHIPLTTRDMDQVLRGDIGALETKLDHKLTTDEHAIIADVAERLRNRAGIIVGLLVGTVVRTFGDGFADTVQVPVEGSFFVKTPLMPEIAETIASALAGKPVEFLPGENLGIQGAVAAAASVR